jgi:hypothetical protein
MPHDTAGTPFKREIDAHRFVSWPAILDFAAARGWRAYC